MTLYLSNVGRGRTTNSEFGRNRRWERSWLPSLQSPYRVAPQYSCQGSVLSRTNLSDGIRRDSNRAVVIPNRDHRQETHHRGDRASYPGPPTMSGSFAHLEQMTLEEQKEGVVQ